MKPEEKLRATPQEVPEQRPDLYVNIVHCGEYAAPNDGVWMRVHNGKVLVKAGTFDPIPYALVRFNPGRVGEFKTNPPLGPQYTGPIDDAMMANILIYGG